MCTRVAGQTCLADQFEPSTTVCNPGSSNPNGVGVCDPDELCTGVAGQACPTDQFEPPTTVCNQGSSNPNGGSICDPDEYCPGTAEGACPVDTIEPADTLCRDAGGDALQGPQTLSGNGVWLAPSWWVARGRGALPRGASPFSSGQGRLVESTIGELHPARPDKETQTNSDVIIESQSPFDESAGSQAVG